MVVMGERTTAAVLPWKWCCSCWCVASPNSDDGGSQWREVLRLCCRFVQLEDDGGGRDRMCWLAMVVAVGAAVRCRCSRW